MKTQDDKSPSDAAAGSRVVDPSPAVGNLLEWCLGRLQNSESELDHAKKYAERGHVVIGEAMRELREDAKVSLRAVAGRLNLSAAYVSDLELGRRNWSETLVRRFVGAIGAEYLPENEKG